MKNLFKSLLEIRRIRQNLEFNIYQADLDYLKRIEEKYEEDKRHLESKHEILQEELAQMQDKNVEQCLVNEKYFYKLHNIEEREAKIVKIEACQKILNSELVEKINKLLTNKN